MRVSSIVLLALALFFTTALTVSADWEDFSTLMEIALSSFDESEFETESDAMATAGWPAARCATDALNVRNGPSMNAKILFTMPKGNKVTVESVENGVWAKIGSGKYSHVDYLKACPAPAKQTKCATHHLNVRNGPSIDAKLLYTMPPGTKVTIHSVSGKWANIGSGKYCHTDYLKACSAPAKQTMCTTHYLNVRSGPSTNAKVLSTMSPGTKVTIHSINGDWANIGSGKYCHKGFLGPCGGGKPPMYKQCDSRWGSHRLGHLGWGTICNQGCLMTSVAMAMAHHGKRINGQVVTPAVLNQFLMNNGGYTGNLYMWYTVSRFGLAYQGQTSDKNAIRAACANPRKIVILNVNGGGHWVLCTGIASNGVTVNDPGSSKTVFGLHEIVLAGIYNV